MAPPLSQATEVKITIGGINKAVALHQRCLTRMNTIVVAARTRKLVTAQGTLACTCASCTSPAKNPPLEFSVNSQLNIIRSGASIRDT